MLLSEWIAKEGLTLEAAAVRLGLPNATVVRRYCHGVIPRDPQRARQICRDTHYEVTLDDLYGIEKPQSAA